MIGEKLSPVLVEIEDALFEFEVNNQTQPNYTDGGFRAAIKICMSVIMDKMWNLSNAENIDMETRCNMAQKCGEDFRSLVKRYTNIDTYSLY